MDSYFDRSFEERGQHRREKLESRESTDWLIAPQLVKPYAKSNRYGTKLSEAGCKATNWPRMRFAGFIIRLEQREGSEPPGSNRFDESPGIRGRAESALAVWSGRERGNAVREAVLIREGVVRLARFVLRDFRNASHLLSMRIVKLRKYIAVRFVLLGLAQARVAQ